MLRTSNVKHLVGVVGTINMFFCRWPKNFGGASGMARGSVRWYRGPVLFICKEWRYMIT